MYQVYKQIFKIISYIFSFNKLEILKYYNLEEHIQVYQSYTPHPQ